MTTIYFVQHGIAESKEVDASRPLSETGKNETRKIASHLKEHGIDVNAVFHSGKLRAEQTAGIFSEILGTGHVSELAGMCPNDDPEKLIAQLDADVAMYVGHLPNVQKVVSKIITSDENNGVIAFQNSAVACVEMDNNEGHLKWFITPDLCS